MHARQALVDYYRLLRTHGCNDSHSGNGSVRVEDTVWITPTGACGDTLTAEDLVACPLDATPEARASLDAPLHLAVYRQTAEAAALLHSHGPHAVALSLAGGDFRPVDFEGRLLFPHVPVIDIEYTDHVASGPAVIADALAAHKAVIARGHGIYARGATLDEAYRWNCCVEASARIAWLAGHAGAAG